MSTIVIFLVLLCNGNSSFPSTSAFIRSHQKVSSNHIYQTSHHVFFGVSSPITDSNIASSSSTDSTPNIDDFFIQQVTLKASALDVKVFRGFSKTAGEHVIEQMQSTPPNIISEEEAIDFIMKNYHNNGDYKYNNNPHYGPETYFMAIYDHNDIENNDDDTRLFTRTNGVVGVVSAQLRKRAPLIAGPGTNNEDKDNTNVRPAVSLPSPHVYVANMSVDNKMQRRGIAMSLLQAIKVYTKSLSEELNEDIPIVLSVDNDNLPAIKLYEKFGFEYLETNDEFRVMILDD